MGLDITAYSHLKPLGLHEDDCTDYRHIHAYAYADFPLSFRGIPILSTRTVPSYDGETSFIEGGCYEKTDATRTHAFRAGSYGGYGQWRADLAAQFNAQSDPVLPFFELIFFADNEGCIGPEAAADLLQDFRSHVDLYKAEHVWDQQKYADWTRACKLAADGGLIDFH